MRVQQPKGPEQTPRRGVTDLSPETERILQALERGQRSEIQPMRPATVRRDQPRRD
ncbi:MAG: hypothetical protein K8J31_13090 [Anaerolineae bacterium]|nr:hypothetical protein [Anaerolineae bacterium]